MTKRIRVTPPAPLDPSDPRLQGPSREALVRAWPVIAMVLTIQGGNSGALILDQRGLALVDRGLDDLRVCLCLVCGVAGEPSTLSAFLAQ
jgi:hypothetical protein